MPKLDTLFMRVLRSFLQNANRASRQNCTFVMRVLLKAPFTQNAIRLPAQFFLNPARDIWRV